MHGLSISQCAKGAKSALQVDDECLNVAENECRETWSDLTEVTCSVEMPSRCTLCSKSLLAAESSGRLIM